MIRLLLSLLCLAAALAATPAAAAPERYRLDAGKTRVDFIYMQDGCETAGRMPVHSADIRLDLDALPDSRIAVALNARAAQAGSILATQAMRGAKMLDARRHPLITFRSTAIRGSPGRATVTGLLTVRGVTQPVTLEAGIYRQPGTDPTDRSRLTVLLTGEISRAAFGASGYSGIVGDAIRLRILAFIEK